VKVVVANQFGAAEFQYVGVNARRRTVRLAISLLVLQLRLGSEAAFWILSFPSSSNEYPQKIKI
jgi:hypothetical protein